MSIILSMSKMSIIFEWSRLRKWTLLLRNNNGGGRYNISPPFRAPKIRRHQRECRHGQKRWEQHHVAMRAPVSIFTKALFFTKVFAEVRNQFQSGCTGFFRMDPLHRPGIHRASSKKSMMGLRLDCVLLCRYLITISASFGKQITRPKDIYSRH